VAPLKYRSPRCPAIRSDSRASSSYGCQRLPHALNPKPTTAISPASLCTNTGPLSRLHESLIGNSSGVTPDAHRLRTSGADPGLQTITTGSNATIAEATAA
jgi:hypothetical protein